MAIISPITFDPLERFSAVRLQQGVPLVDADWNELDEARRFELRASIHSYVGDGSPEGADPFRIVGDGGVNDFVIAAGFAAPDGLPSSELALHFVGRCAVEGQHAMISSDLRFREQPLHVSRPGAVALGAAWGVPVVPELPFTASVIFLDLWERLVTPAEDPDLVDDVLGIESCARMKREWVVRWRTSGATEPRPGDADYVAGHSYVMLAQLRGRDPGGTGAVEPSDVLVDQRERRLLTPPATLVEDMLGTTLARYRRGLDRPVTSLREALNALIAGDLSGAPSRTLGTVSGAHASVAVLATNRLIATWELGASPLISVRYARLNLADPGAGWSAPVVLASGQNAYGRPVLAALPGGAALIAYLNGAGLFLTKVNPDGTAAAAVSVAASGAKLPSLAVSGDIAVLVFQDTASGWVYRRWRHSDGVWLDAAPVSIATILGATPAASVAVASDGRVVVVLGSNNGPALPVHVVVIIDRASGVVGAPLEIGARVGVSVSDVVAPASGGALVFHGLGTIGRVTVTELDDAFALVRSKVLADSTNVNRLVGGQDSMGGVWLTYSLPQAGVPATFLIRRDAASGAFTPPRALLLPPNNSPAACVVAPDGSSWLFYAVSEAGGARLAYRQLFTVI